MKKEEVIEWLTIIKANLNSFPEVSNAKKIEALGEAIRFIKNEESEKPSGSEKPNKSEISTGSTTKNDLAHNLCDSCTNIGCEFQSGIVRTECAFYMPPHIEPDNCGNYIVQNSTAKNDLGVDCICRDSAIKALNYDIKYFEFKSGVSKHMDDIAKLLNTIYETQVNNIKALPSVTQIRPKGHWIWVFDETPSTPNSPYEVNYAGWVCSCCHKFPDDICEWDDPDEPPTYKFCPNCGSDNREVVE